MVEALLAALGEGVGDAEAAVAAVPDALASEPHALGQLAEQLKAEAERQLHLLPARSATIGAVIRNLGMWHGRLDVCALGELAIADAQRDQGAYPRALEAYDRAATLYEQAGDRVGWARTRIGAAATRRITGELAIALREAEEARPVLEAAAVWGRLARLESVIGLLLRELGRYPEALEAYARGRAAAARVEPAEARALLSAELLINEAIVHLRIDQFESAEQQLREAAAIFRDHQRLAPMAQAEANRARVLAAQGRVSEALALVNDVRERLRALGRAAEAAMVGQAGVQSWLLLNRPAEASALADAVVADLEANAAGNELARTLLDRAVAREQLGRPEDAVADLARAERVFADGGAVTWVALVQLRRAELLQRSGEHALALAEAQRAQRALGRHHAVARARACLVQAQALRQLGDRAAAARQAERARSVARRRGVPWLEYQSWRVLAEVALHEGDQPHALRAYGHAIEALEESQGRILIEQRPAFLADKLGVYEAAVRLSVGLGRPRQAFAYTERAKGRALLDALALQARDVGLRPATPAARKLADELASLRRRHDRLSDPLGTQPLMPADEPLAPSGVDDATVAAQLARDEARMAAILEELRLGQGADMERLALLQGRVYSPLPQLGTRSALVEYIAVGSDIAIFVLRRGQGTHVTWAPGPNAVAWATRLRGALDLSLNAAAQARGDVARLRALESHTRSVLQRLYGLLLEPVAEALEGVDHLIVVPHGVLHCLPFGALHDGQRYLIERCEVVLSPSASAVVFCRRPVRRPARQALIVGHSGGGLLPGALAEAELIGSLYPGTRLLEEQATLAAVRAGAAEADIIHIAAHGLSRPEAPLFSHVRLDDGQLTALDCLDLSLDCSLVTLSACETGRALVAPGDDLIGLGRSLLYAGARSIVQSLWRVDDTATQHIMSSFYRHLRAGLGRSAALRAAQRERLQDDGADGQVHPFFWAAFTLVGDWSPLPTRGTA